MTHFKLNKIKYPYITSKIRQCIYGNQKKGRKYCFLVNSSINKKDIKVNIEKFFGVNITKINTIKKPAKKKHIGKYSGYTNKYKKIIIQLKRNQNIKYFYGI
uniref:Ribosomal protein L23 n=1 Tax=Nitzschia sp. NIES-3576 TaxID=2083273 RepID=A0A2Z5ZBB2_9STRA|nr:ribosomal protein L23 [Nitzschia sp. NIES-3576]